MLKIGQLIDDKYRILDIIGEGGMSVVYLARNERTNITWAIKEIKKVGEEDAEVKRNSLIAEIDMLKKLKNEYLPKIIDVINDNDSILIVMEYIEGNDLDVKLEEEGAQSQEDVIKWAKQLCNVLNYLHHRNPKIIYRDMKPANIMLKPDNNISVIDFGTAREVEVKNVKNTKSLGTEGYAAPEQYGENAYADERTDIYNFGATIFHLITGEYPDPFRICEHPIREYNPTLSGGIEKIIIKCTQLDPENRYQNCDELQQDLDNYEYIDEQTISKNKSKIIKFFVSLVLSLVCFAVAIFGYYQNTNQINAKYEDYINEKNYAEALKLDDTKIDAYEGIVDELEKEGFNDNDAKSLDLLESYESSGKNSNGETVYPLNDLAENNIKGYVQTCYSIGENYCLRYKTLYSRTDKATRWFKRILPSDYLDININDYKNSSSYQISVSGKTYSISIGDDKDITPDEFQYALVTAQINDCKDSISKNTGGTDSGFSLYSNENDKKNAYKNFWKKLLLLKDLSKKLSDEQLSFAICEEICVEVKDRDRLDGIVKYNNLSAVDIEKNLLQPLETIIKSKGKSEKANALIDEINSLREFVNEYYEG